MKAIKRNLFNLVKVIKAIIKSLSFLALVIFYLIGTLFVNITEKDKAEKLRKLSLVASFLTSLALKVLDVKVNILDESNILSDARSVLVVSNHLSYLDIFIISSIIPSIFIAGVDGVQEQFIIGKLTKLSGSIFVERRGRSKLGMNLKQVTDAFSHNINLVLFPEGTTTNGETVIPFKSSFFQSAAASGSSVLPLCIKYKGINGEPVNKDNRDLLYFYGEAPFFRHFFTLLMQRDINVDLIVLDLINVDEFADRKELSAATYNSILSSYRSN